ncbi:glycosyltransferase family 4 protein [Acidimicrobiia bacterium EGI L10123]|nr:glycosyltransferase family 4 protein [Acidimicrobiia bacterium EGI L10123]
MGVPDEYCVRITDDLSPDPTKVVSVGALRPKKGHDLLIRAVAELDQVSLDIVGEGAERQKLERLVLQLGATDRVRFRGHVDQWTITELLDHAAVFCLASRVTESGDRDGVPNVLIEAMARGVPVIATKVSGIPDLLADGRGSVVAEGDVPGLRNAIAEALADPSDARERAQSALEHVRENYTTTSNWVRMASVLRDRIG